MKKIFLSLLFAGSVLLVNAQKSEVNAAKNAWILIANGGNKPLSETLKLLNDGLAHTDKAIADEKTSQSAEAWGYRALLSSRIALIDTTDLSNSKAKQKIADEAIEKGNALNPKDQDKKNFEDAKSFVEDAVRNRGVLAYKKKDYAMALDAFNEVTKRNPKDTAIYVNAALMAKQINNYPEVIRNYKEAIALNYPESALLYKDMISIYLKDLKDSTAAIAMIQEASGKFPGDNDLIGMETDYYIKKGDIAKSQEMLKKLIEKNPTNPTYNIIMGDIYFKQATDLQEQKNKLDPKKVKEFNELSAKMKAVLNQAIPYYKAAVATDAKNINALENLKSIYFFLDDKANTEVIQKQLDAIK
ncbi:hypothetical protein [Pedobacter sp. JY14-1]|uniref:tetratricopeptide repeat protein n=1 Tax=Pedobacter sp. JY14-1 TaxID=3034151 RepID=UPI0023E2F5DA|nr:hypothetical protein [Pedobacter sp. JY14-1]